MGITNCFGCFGCFSCIKNFVTGKRKGSVKRIKQKRDELSYSESSSYERSSIYSDYNNSDYSMVSEEAKKPLKSRKYANEVDIPMKRSKRIEEELPISSKRRGKRQKSLYKYDSEDDEEGDKVKSARKYGIDVADCMEKNKIIQGVNGDKSSKSKKGSEQNFIMKGELDEILDGYLSKDEFELWKKKENKNEKLKRLLKEINESKNSLYKTSYGNSLSDLDNSNNSFSSKNSINNNESMSVSSGETLKMQVPCTRQLSQCLESQMKKQISKHNKKKLGHEKYKRKKIE